jgi:glycosyltransferase involved in cell wall biosynthesis
MVRNADKVVDEVNKNHNSVGVALVGVDTNGVAPGGMATISRTLISGFEHNPVIDILPISNFDEGSRYRRLYMGVGAVWQVMKRRRRIDLVHIQVAVGWSIERDLLLAAVARLLGLPVIAQFHGAGQIDDFTTGPAVHRLGYRMLLRLCHNVALGKNVLDWLQSVEHGARATIIPNGVDVPDDPSSFPDGPPSMVFVGRLGQRKGVYDLLAAFEQLEPSGHAFQLKLLGDGEVAEIQRRVDSSPFLRQYVSILGWQDEDSVKRALSAAWALVLPSYAEGLPMAILEAMAAGRAVVATRVGDVETLVHDDVNGILVRAGDISGLADALDRIANDSGLARRLGVEGHKMAKSNFTNAMMLHRLEALYLDVATGASDT